jgi:tellurite resistance protein TerC
MIAGASWQWWVGFHAAVALLLIADGGWSSRRSASPRSVWVAPAVLLTSAAGFAVWLAAAHGRQPALEWAAGYTIELSLSVDNLFVFMFLFHGFEVGPKLQHKALAWGIGGAVVLRALFIVAGIALLDRFEWVAWVFGFFLLYACWRMLRGQSGSEVLPGWIRNLHPRQGSLLPVILAVEFTDLIFALDSIPAVLAVTRNPLLAYTSNVAAILGLRSLYFALLSALDRFRSLHYGVGALLAFVGLKMLASPWFDLPIGISLGIIALILAVCIGFDLVTGRVAGPLGRDPEK